MAGMAMCWAGIVRFISGGSPSSIGSADSVVAVAATCRGAGRLLRNHVGHVTVNSFSPIGARHLPWRPGGALPVPAFEMVDLPAQGRTFTTGRRVRLGDVAPSGRLRLDAVARYLQDVADDDTRDAAYSDATGWVVRRTVIEIRRFPRFLEPLSLTTWCSGTGGRWAERRVSIVGELGGRVEAATLWVHLDPRTMRPRPLPASFFEVFGPSTMGRRVRSALRLSDPGADVPSTPWPLRATDLDVMRHVNNAVSWVAVEERLAVRTDLRAPLRAELEHRGAIDAGSEVTLRWADAPDALQVWLVDAAGNVPTGACVEPLAG
jgi:acyl-ACP thioesterase